MGYIQDTMAKHSGGAVQLANTPEKAGLGPRTSVQKQHEIKSGRLKSQLFAYTVTNQVVNTFLELGLPFILRFVNDWRQGKASLKDLSKNGHKAEGSTADADPEKHFLDRVENQLGLPDYSTFTDYAEMVTQFGYITVWSIVWPIAPVFAFINNYIELRSDALKICKHVRQPIGDRVETIGSWLDTMSIISWIGAVTNATLIYLFRPGFELHDHDHPSPHLQSHGSAHLATIVSAYSSTHSTRALLPTLIPLGLVALAASHGWFVLRWIVDAVAERTLWRGSPEEVEVQRMTASSSKRVEQKLEKLDELAKKVAAKSEEKTVGGFWNGGEEGAREIARVGKADDPTSTTQAGNKSSYIAHSDLGTAGYLKLDSVEAFDQAVALQEAASVQETDPAYKTLALLNSEDGVSPLRSTVVESLLRIGFHLGADERVAHGSRIRRLYVCGSSLGLRDLTGRKFSACASNGSSGMGTAIASALELRPAYPRRDGVSFEDATSFAAERSTAVNSSVLTERGPFVATYVTMHQEGADSQVILASRPTDLTDLKDQRSRFTEGKPWKVGGKWEYI
ncbi:hypothetical protein EHS25_005213 [Saitozyma podzolica]|uniref:Anoctamin transmembrane domain-containing protein n=1 Tax=Saitozyma podzolica TaxID=1890683 RepID=A0A427XYN9_9TREE|nr:hypothetical protein EHS25_005213 [Saitozyma podzolica]